MDFHQTWYTHWYCGHLGWHCWWANFCHFVKELSAHDMIMRSIIVLRFYWHIYLHAKRLDFRFQPITTVNINGISPNLVCITAEISFRIANGQFLSFLESYLSAPHTIVEGYILSFHDFILALIFHAYCLLRKHFAWNGKDCFLKKKKKKKKIEKYHQFFVFRIFVLPLERWWWKRRTQS